MVCRSVLAESSFLRSLLQQSLTDNLNEVSQEEVERAVRLTVVRPAPPKADANGQSVSRAICGFEVELAEETNSPHQVLQDFAGALAEQEGVEHVLKFFDDLLLKQSLALAQELFALEMKLRRALSIIYLAAYEDGYYNLLRDEKTEIATNEKQTPEHMKKLYENEFFYLLFKQYIYLNQRRLPSKVEDLMILLRDANGFEAFQQELERQPISDEGDRDLLSSLKERLDAVEKLRNCIAHNRTPSGKVIQDYHKARELLDVSLDDFLADFEPDNHTA